MATRKNTMRWIAALLLAAFAMVAMGQSSCSTETSEAPKSEAPAKQKAPAPDPPEVTAAMVADAMAPADIRKLCRSAETVGYDTSLSYFKVGFQGSDGISAEEAFEEMLSRC